MGFGEALLKNIIFTVNFVFALAGLTSLVLGILVQVKISTTIDQTNTVLQTAPITTMMVGGMVFLAAFFGCYGAIRKSNFMLITYAIFMVSVMAVQLFIAIMVFVSLDAFIAGVQLWLDEAFMDNQPVFHELESVFKCCGTTGPTSYGNIFKLPSSCCSKTVGCLLGLAAYVGCYTAVDNFIRSHRTNIGMGAIAMAAIALVAVVLALCLANHARKRNASSNLLSFPLPTVYPTY